jgi:hypothetical protein
VGTRTGFHADFAARLDLLQQHLELLLSHQPSVPDSLAMAIHTVQLKDIFRPVNTCATELVHGGTLFSVDWWITHTQSGTLMTFKGDRHALNFSDDETTNAHIQTSTNWTIISWC